MLSCLENVLKPGSDEFEQFIHHLFCIYGSLVAISCGRFIGVVMSASLLTEFSTPSVNVWWLLSIHKKTDSKLYEYNAYALFTTFFLFRIVYQFWLIAWLCIPGITSINMSLDSNLM